MRARLVTILGSGGVALALAAQAFAVGEPVQNTPEDRAIRTSGDQITFSASPTNGATPPLMDFYIWTSPPPGSTGAPTGWIDHFQGAPASHNPAIYAATPNPDEAWPKTPGAYYWQAVYHDCTQNPPECFVKSPIRSLTINPLPAPVAQAAPQVETFLNHHPRRRVRQRKVMFFFSSNVAGASFECLFAEGWAGCQSPHTFRRLEPGRYKFEARAVVDGVTDPTPVSWVFKVRRKLGARTR